jgi:hypothetical protein
MAHFLNGSDCQTKDELVLKQKQETGVDELCGGLPFEFAT